MRSPHCLIEQRKDSRVVHSSDELQTMTAARLLIVEDHAVLAQTLTVALRAEGYEIHMPDDLTLDGVVTFAESTEADVVLLDLDLGADASGVSMIAPLHDLGAEVVVVTGTSDAATLGECLEAGASGVFRKSQPFEQLVDAIKIAAGHGAVTPETARAELMRELRARRAKESARTKPLEQLTPRESQVLHLLVDGKSADKIAAELVVSLATVRTQIRSILIKLGVNSQLEAVAMARRSGWFSV
jgi:DNA-binding NarL/FixJ family response regulator